jgi:hypothetical protein
MACIAAADAGGGRPTPALRSKSGLLRPTKSELLQDKKSRTGKTSTRTSKKDGAGADTLVLLPARPALCCNLTRLPLSGMRTFCTWALSNISKFHTDEVFMCIMLCRRQVCVGRRDGW